jgi:hypothetical protein
MSLLIQRKKKTGYHRRIKRSGISVCAVLFAAWNAENWPIKMKLQESLLSDVMLN